jgi:hypothetical protein
MSKKARDKDWRKDPLENTPPVSGSGNFLKDRGYSNPTLLTPEARGGMSFPPRGHLRRRTPQTID